MKKMLFIFGLVVLVLAGGIYIFEATKLIPKHTTTSIIPPVTQSITRTAIPTVAPSGVVHVLKTVQMKMAENYFAAFTDCMKNPPAAARGNVQSFCETHNAFAGSSLSANLKAQYAPVVCGQNPPESVSATKTTNITDKSSTVLMTYAYGAQTQNVTYQLAKEGNNWKVEDIICPRP